jgi:1-pyrroline-5-carboxylate dehydrogenase
MTALPRNFPRVTYTNTSADFEPLHAMLDIELPRFRKSLGNVWPNWIGGAADKDGVEYACVSPLDSAIVLGRAIEPTASAVTRAVGAARKAYDVWGAMPWQDRVAAMRRVATIVDQKKYEMAMAVLYEVGKTRIEALGETEEAVALIEHYCDQMEKNGGFIENRVPSGPSETAGTVLRPYGVFAVISPFNYPVGLVANMVGAALVAGNTVVLKATPKAVLSAGLFAAAMKEADLPAGAFNLLMGEKSGPLLVAEPGIDGVAFTGSNRTGMSIMREFARHNAMRPVLAEMGGKNPAYVSKSAELDVAIEGVARSAFLMQGQKCSACSAAFVHSSLYDRFIEGIVKRAQAFKSGITESREFTNGPLINEAAFQRYQDAVAHAKKNGRVLFGGNRVTTPQLERGFFVEPTIVVDLPEKDRLYTDELFAPLVAISKFDDLGDALKRGNAVQYGLTAGFYGTDQKEIDFFMDHVEAGILYINRKTGATTGAWPGIQSYCGWKGSGLTGKGGLGQHYLPQFMREQSRTIRQVA